MSTVCALSLMARSDFENLGHLESALHIDGSQIVRRAGRRLQTRIGAKQQRAARHMHENFAKGADAFHRPPVILFLGDGFGQRQALPGRAQKRIQEFLARR